ncbi:hypothetical protein [Corynebacterium timonense]|uniref:Maltokinase n=1 Tax=Corynebacterium timonense TaxID=441500 RepID=A0A1H1M298_9CORY|nr:hypothetical protein [Corynebacterium timonense]SDR80149.1 maltokinase [Corynebacterium timonense]
MSDGVFDIARERFYGAKSEPVDSVEVAARAEAGEYEWRILDVTHGPVTDAYQVFLRADSDALATQRGAQAYLDNLPRFGEVRGTIGGTTARPLGAEQSNTSLVVDERWVLKVFRRLERGVNPDVELLTAIAHCPNVAGVRGHVVRDGATLALQQELIVGGTDGFELATADALGDPAQLGAAVRTVHEALAGAFGTRTVPGATLREGLNAHLDEMLPQAAPLARFEQGLRALYARIPDEDTGIQIQRIHGDLHLGQTLKTDERWFLIDFEGEPARPLEQRRAPDHPLRDVAGMVRSFGYAAAVGGFDAEWETRGVEKLLAGYGVEAGPILEAYVADKAAYEVVYEANNRPDWVGIPLGAIATLVSHATGQ